ncbi:MAG: GTP-binding protein [Candidatus Lokiarchaeota archaeon]|nr:GTP-binding protein [Candidatus Lokiarchaeota archaeon]
MPLKKIIFLGVDNAGKSTILNLLSEKYSLISNQKPTIKIERKKMEKIFGYDIINWDFPGQKSYRDEYLDDVEKTLMDTDLMIYIIDVQDYRRIMESITFFKNVIKKFMENKMEGVPIFVFFHKLDPDIRNDKTFLSNIDYIRNETSKIADTFDIYYFITTIYDKWSIFYAFSKVFKILLPEAKEQKIRNILERFAEYNGFNSVLLMNEKNIIINEFSIDSNSSEIINSLALTLSTVYDIAVEKKLGNQVKIDLLSGEAILFPIKLYNDSDFFLLGYLNKIEPDFEVKSLEDTVKSLKKIQDISEVK